jgi:hypothetical protein
MDELCSRATWVNTARMGQLKKLLTILMVTGVSLLSAQDFRHSAMTPQANDRDDSVAVGVRCEPPSKGLMIAVPDGARKTEPVLVKFSDKEKPKRSGSTSILSSLREKMNSLADRFPDLSVSCLGVSWYVRNPLRYRLAPGRTYGHQMGFNAGDWFLSVDGIQPNTLEDLRLALQCPVGSKINLFLRYSDSRYWVDVHALGKLPWE